MSLNETEKINYIKKNFHQSFDLELNTDFTTTETVNLVIPIGDLTNENIVSQSLEDYHHDTTLPDDTVENILSKYNDTDITDSVKCVCMDVIDGDTIDVKVPLTDNEGNILLDENEKQTYLKLPRKTSTGQTIIDNPRIRLVGINTPEINYEGQSSKGADVSKEFLEKICYSEEYYNQLKAEREAEEAGTSLDIPEEDRVYNNKIIYVRFDKVKTYDEYGRVFGVLIVDNKNINEVILKEKLGEIMYIPPCEFNPFEWGNEETTVHIYRFSNSDISTLSPFFNTDMNNVVFTPKNNLDKIYRYEYYKGVYYIKLQPYSKKITMHLLPKYYDCSDNVLIFRDNEIKSENIRKTDDYYHFKSQSPINSYFMVNNVIRDRTSPDISEQQYSPTDSFCEFFYDISNRTKSFKNLQICSGYRYNNSTPYFSVHFTGIRDNTNIQVEDRCTLIDANFDNIENVLLNGEQIDSIEANNITQYYYDDEFYIPKNPMISYARYNINHLENIERLYHKNLKYINDTLYSEERNLNNKKYTIANWNDISDD